MTFWILAALMAALLVLVLLRPLLRRRAPGPAAADFDRAVYRDQLAELEEDRRRGLIDTAEAEAARREIGRRLLQTEQASPAAGAAGGAWPRRLALAAIVALPPVLGLGLYLHLGTPGLPGLPLAGRDPGGPVEMALLAERLQARIEAEPEDIEARLVLAQVHERQGRFAEAATVYRAAIDAVGRQGPVPEIGRAHV